MLRIMVTNDDGIDAQGIRRLVEALLDIQAGEVYVVAPSAENSGVGHAITYRTPLDPREHPFYGMQVEAWAVNGTPADCVKAAYHLLFAQKEKPDIVFSGVNVGNNLGKDIYYSGTCSAAREAVILGIPAVAFSYDNYFHADDFGDVVEIIKPLLREFCQKAERGAMPREVFWNVNIPHLKREEICGIAPAVLSLYHYHDVYLNEKEGYLLQRAYRGAEEHGEREDYRLLKSGYITVTPVHIDSTDHSLLEDVARWDVTADWIGKKV